MNSSEVLSSIDTGILLEAGTNEAEILVFRVRDRRYGVNVAKVREVLPVESLTPIAKSHEAVDGLVAVREFVVPLINLDTFLHDKRTDESVTEDNFLLLEFNRQHVAFRVQVVERIFRVSWQDTLPAPQMGHDTSPITSIWRLDKELVPLIDFEAITASIGIGGQDTTIHSLPENGAAERAKLPIIFADDSLMISEMIKDSLLDSGFKNLKSFRDGDELWNYLKELTRDLSPEQVKPLVAGIITDVEMPGLDGFSLTKRIRNHPPTAETPVIVFSSIASEDNMKKGVQVGATTQIAKPGYDELVKTVAQLF